MAAVEWYLRGVKLIHQFQLVSAGWLEDDQFGFDLFEQQFDELGDARRAVFDDERFLSVDRDVDFVFGDVGSGNDFVVAFRSVFLYSHFILLS